MNTICIKQSSRSLSEKEDIISKSIQCT
jgi:hypothetical protein